MIRALVQQQLFDDLEKEDLFIIQGSRGVGKTELLEDLRQVFVEQGKQVCFFDVYKERFNPKFDTPERFCDHLKNNYVMSEHAPLPVLLDNANALEKPAHFLMYLHTLLGRTVKLFCTTSTTLAPILLEEKTHRLAKTYTLSSYSWYEYMGAVSDQVYDNAIEYTNINELISFYKVHRVDFEKHLPGFLRWGGYPPVVRAKSSLEKQEAMHEVIDRYLEKDATYFLRAPQLRSYLSFLRLLATESTELMNHDDVSIRLNLHKKTLAKYVHIASSTFVFTFLTPFFTDGRREMSKMTKIYPHDLGLVSTLSGGVQVRYGEEVFDETMIKNFVFTELMKNHSIHDLQFYRTIAKAEIDFVAHVGDEQLIPIEIAWRQGSQKVSVAMKNFVKKYEKRVKQVIVLTQDDVRQDGKILYIPVVLLPFLEFGG